MTDDEIRKLAGDPDCLPILYIEYFLLGWKACENYYINKGFSKTLKINIKDE